MRRDRADLEGKPRCPRERIATLVIGCRAGVCRLTPERHARALDAEGAEHNPERDVHRLEHRPLLDVQLEIGARVLELRARVQRAVERDAVAADRVGSETPSRSVSLASSSWSRIDPAAADEPKSDRPKRAPPRRPS